MHTFFAGLVARIRPEEMPDEDEEEEVASPPTKKAKKTKDLPKRLWKKNDIGHPPLPNFTHPMPQYIKDPFQYFLDMLPMEMLEDIVYQTNLYARQKDVNTNFSINIQDLMSFIGIILYMGIVQMPSLDDYWATSTCISQITVHMTAKRFKQIKSFIHFNNNESAKASMDRFFKIRPLFSGITKQFLHSPLSLSLVNYCTCRLLPLFSECWVRLSLIFCLHK